MNATKSFELKTISKIAHPFSFMLSKDFIPTEENEELEHGKCYHAAHAYYNPATKCLGIQLSGDPNCYTIPACCVELNPCLTLN